MLSEHLIYIYIYVLYVCPIYVLWIRVYSAASVHLDWWWCIYIYILYIQNNIILFHLGIGSEAVLLLYSYCVFQFPDGWIEEEYSVVSFHRVYMRRVKSCNVRLVRRQKRVTYYRHTPADMHQWSLEKGENSRRNTHWKSVYQLWLIQYIVTWRVPQNCVNFI